MPTKKEGNEQLSASDFAYVPNPESVSTWKLRIDSASHVSAAVAALGKGFMGNKVQIPAKDLPAVKRKVAAAYRKFFPDNELPPVLKSVKLEVKIDEESVVSGLVDKLFNALSEFFIEEASDDVVEDAQDVALAEDTQIMKAYNEELRQATFVVLEADVVDLHGDTYSADEVRKAAHNFWTYCQKAYVDHSQETSSATIVENYIAPVDMLIGDRLIRKGAWLQVWQFDNTLWPAVKSGQYNGVSIGAYAKCESL